MKQVRLTNEEVGALCLSLAQLYHSGISSGDALALLAEDDHSAFGDTLRAMAERADDGVSLSRIFRESACFPAYTSALLEVGECVGKTEATLNALARYYERRAQISHRLRTALLYPAVLMAVLLAVIVILLVWVLPVFNDVYAQLGSSLTGIAGGLLKLGAALKKLMPLLCVLLGLCLAAAVILSVFPRLRATMAVHCRKLFGHSRISHSIHTAHFAQALSMGLNSGLTPQESVALGIRLVDGNSSFTQHCESCLAYMEAGASLAEALQKSKFLSGAECRLLEAGIRSGSAELIMEQISERLFARSEAELESRVELIEPALVVLMSVMVGIILLSVMLPLMHIMTTIG